jgi:hypothetical protein
LIFAGYSEEELFIVVVMLGETGVSRSRKEMEIIVISIPGIIYICMRYYYLWTVPDQVGDNFRSISVVKYN